MTSTGGREVSGALTGALVRYIERVLGAEGVRRVFELAGESRPVDVVGDPSGWSSHDQTARLFEAAAEVTDDPEVGQRIGEELVPLPTSAAGTTAILHALGSPGEVLRNIAVTSAKYANVIRMDATEVGDRHAVVICETLPPHVRSKLFCGYTIGVIARTPQLFGMDPATVVETECQADGAPHCVFRVEWDPRTSPEYDPQREIDYLQLQLTNVSSRFEALQQAASELVTTAGVEDALEVITAKARLAVRSPQFLLAVRTSPGGELHIHHDGMTDDEARVLSAEILADEPDDHGGSRLIVDVASRQASFGRLAAIQPAGHRFFKEEGDLLGAYAGIAASALATAAALDEARRRERNSTALLALARSLAEVGTRDEVAQGLASAVPEVIAGCDVASVLLWDAAAAAISAVAVWDVAADALREVSPLSIGEDESALLADMLVEPTPRVVDDAACDAVISMACENVRSAIVVPIAAKNVFYGAIVVAVVEGSGHDDFGGHDELTALLAGMAGQAATALENAHLLERMRYQALHDALTGTPNQRLLEDRVDTAIAMARRNPEHLALLFLDLDRFKNVNDTLGHAYGDMLLQQATARFKDVVRGSDTVARLGGDEFAVLLPRLEHPSGAEKVAEKLLEVLEQPFQLGEDRAFVSGSIGIAIYPDHGTDYKALLKCADAAMYTAKARGRGVFDVYDPTMQARDHRQLALEADLHAAVERGQLRVLYQPQLDLRTMKVVGAEALVRWEHPELGLLGPDQFIPLAEETGLIVKIDAWVLRTACAQLGEWNRAGYGKDLRVAVNLSGRDLRDPQLASRVKRAISESGIEPAQLELEVTERVVEAADELFVVLDELRAIGVRLAIDDFGTGNSAFTRLSGGPVDILKIDKGFIQDITSAEDHVPLVEAMISLAHTLGLEVVAEGVETCAQGKFLRRRGCEVMQGYAFSKPVGVDEFERLAAASRERGATGTPPELADADA